MGQIVASRDSFIQKWMGAKSEKERLQADDELRRFVHMQMLMILGKKPKDLGFGPGELPTSPQDFRPATQAQVDEWNGSPARAANVEGRAHSNGLCWSCGKREPVTDWKYPRDKVAVCLLCYEFMEWYLGNGISQNDPEAIRRAQALRL